MPFNCASLYMTNIGAIGNMRTGKGTASAIPSVALRPCLFYLFLFNAKEIPNI